MKRMILFIAFCLFVSTLIMGNLPQTVTNYGVATCYAMGWYHQPDPGSQPCPDTWRKNPPQSVSEPSTLVLLGTGVAGAGIYLFVRKRNKKK
jgi:hypothetical protein